MDDFTDQELLSRYALSACEAAFTVLVERHLAVVFHAARRRLSDHQLSEEVAQTVFAILARKAATLSRHPCLLSWLFQTTHYVAKRAARAEHRRKAALQAHQRNTQMTLPSKDEHGEHERRRLLDHLLQRLNGDDRNILLLHYVEGRTFGEIGGILGKSEGASRVQAHRAVQKLSRWLQKKGHTTTNTLIGSSVASLFAGKVTPAMALRVRQATLDLAPRLGTTELARLSLHATSPFQLTVIALTLTTLLTGLAFIQQTVRLQQLERQLGEAAGARETANRPALVLDRKPRVFKSALIERLAMDPSTLTADDLVQNTLRSMFLGAPDYELIARLDELEISALLDLVSDLKAHPIPRNLKPVHHVFWAIGKKNPKLSCELSLQESGHLFSTFHHWLSKDPLAAVDWLAAKRSSEELPDESSALIRLAASAMIPHDRARAFQIMRWSPVPEKGSQLAMYTAELIEHGTPPSDAIAEASELMTQHSPDRLVSVTIRMLGSKERKLEAQGLIDEWYGGDSEKWLAAMLSVRSALVSRKGGFAEETDWVLEQTPPERKPHTAREMAKSLAQWDDQVAKWIETLRERELSDQARLGLVEGLSRRGNVGRAKAQADQIQSAELRTQVLDLITEHSTPRVARDWDLEGIQLSLEP